MRTVTLTGIVAAVLAVALAWLVGPAFAAGPRGESDNPVPFISSLSPSAAAVAGPAFALTVDGAGFVPGSAVHWNGTLRPTTYLSASQLTAQIGAADIAVAQVALVTVVTPAPGGGVSAAASYLVAPPNPVPDVTGLSPAQAMVGDGPFQLTVLGSGFVPGSSVLWNGADRTTGFVNELMLTATIRSSDVAAAGTAFVSVLNPEPGGGQSASARVFTIVYPQPVLDLLEPASVWAGGSAFTLSLTGSRFTPASVVQWAGVDRPTAFVSAECLEAQVGAADVARAGPESVRVFTPGPGGGLSSAMFVDVRDDDVPPVTEAQGLKRTWNRATTSFTLVATDVGLGVEQTFYRFGASATPSIGTKVTVKAPKDHSNDGLHTIQFYSIDKVLNWEFPAKEVQVGVDTRPPTTSVASVKVKRGGTMTPRYRIDDSTSPRTLDALLIVADRAGKVVYRCDLGRPVTRMWRRGGACRIDLPKGAYRMRILAHDLAGNAQSSTRSGVLTVY